MGVERLAMPAAYSDLAYRRCLRNAVANGEFVDEFNRLHGAPLQGAHDHEYLHAFTRHVHDLIYMRLTDEAILALRVDPQQVQTS